MKKHFLLIVAATLLTSWSNAMQAQDALEVTASQAHITQNFDSMWDGTAATLTMPEGWRVDRNLTAARTVGSFASASSTVMYTGGTNLASNAKNGTWNFQSSAEPSDCSVGGLSTTVADGTRCINVMTSIKNAASEPLSKLTFSYDIEKYRNGDNPEGFAVQLYTSTDGTNWSSAGTDFYNYFAPDAATAGAATVPITTTAVAGKQLKVNLAAGEVMYLAWNISVASGDAAQGAMALAIDDFTIKGELPKIPVSQHYIFVNDQTGWDALGLYAWGDSELFGAWPGQASVGDSIVNNTNYKVFLLDANSGNYHLIFNNWNNGVQLPDYDIVADRDYFFTITADGVTEDETAVIECMLDAAPVIQVNGKQVTYPGNITVYNTNGQTVAIGKDSMGLAHLSRGIYIVQGRSGSNVSTIKITIGS